MCEAEEVVNWANKRNLKMICLHRTYISDIIKHLAAHYQRGGWQQESVSSVPTGTATLDQIWVSREYRLPASPVIKWRGFFFFFSQPHSFESYQHWIDTATVWFAQHEEPTSPSQNSNLGTMPEMLWLLILIRFVSSKNACLINSFPQKERQTISTPWIIRQNGNMP